MAPRVVAAVAGVPTVLGVIATLVEASTAAPFSIADAAYYVGAAACGALLGSLAAAAVVGALEDQLGDTGSWVAGLVVLSAAAILGVVVADPPSESSGATFGRIVGVITIAGGIAAFAAVSRRN